MRSRLLSRVRDRMREDARRPDAAPAAPPTAPPRSPAADVTPPVRAPLPAADLDQLEAEARYHRERLALYRARVHGGKPASTTRLRELGRTSAAAEARLRHARGR